MRRREIMRPDDAAIKRASRRWRLGILASAGGALLGIIASLYSAELRNILETSGREFVTTGLPVAVTAAVASVSGVLIYEFGFRRRQQTGVTEGAIDIRSDVLDAMTTTDQVVVVGRSLRYLESRRYTQDLLVFLPGLGLDANDFRPYLAESKFHCVALTLYGFNPQERNDRRYQSISLRSHVQLVAYALRRLQHVYPRKRISLVGFSFGADLIVCLLEFAPTVLGEINLHRVYLLDPNINNETTRISSQVANMGDDHSLRDLTGILRTAKTTSEFRYLCAYLSKITSKNLTHVRRHARDMVARYRQRTFGPFLDALGQLSAFSDGVNVVLSLNHEEVFNKLGRAAAARGLDLKSLECSRTDHFDLLRPKFLQDRLEA